MTGYGRSETEGTQYRIVVEVRSLNSRYLDISLRLPSGGWALEPMIRKRVQERFKRGRIEIHVHLEPMNPEVECPVELQVGRARSYLRALEALQSDLDIPGNVDLALMASFRDLLWTKDTALEEELQALEAGLQSALDSLEAMRRSEGQTLQTDLQERIVWMDGEIERIKTLAPELLESHKKRWIERLQSLMVDQTLDPARLEQEMVIWIDRMDVTEELVRLGSHLSQCRRLLKQGHGVGRKLEFMLQEIHREVNTLGSKAMDAEVSHRAVEMKAQIERMREQAQNVE
jgi:uncharacterized protein (TIGR00255 family)